MLSITKELKWYFLQQDGSQAMKFYLEAVGEIMKGSY